MHLSLLLSSLPGRIDIGSRPLMPKPFSWTRWLRNAMETLAERALLAAVRHVTKSAPEWTDDRVTDREELHAWNRILMTNRRLWCNRLVCEPSPISEDRRVCEPSPISEDSAAERDESWCDSENPPQDTSSSDSDSPNWYDRKTGRQRW